MGVSRRMRQDPCGTVELWTGQVSVLQHGSVRRPVKQNLLARAETVSDPVKHCPYTGAAARGRRQELLVIAVFDFLRKLNR